MRNNNTGPKDDNNNENDSTLSELLNYKYVDIDLDDFDLDQYDYDLPDDQEESLSPEALNEPEPQPELENRVEAYIEPEPEPEYEPDPGPELEPEESLPEPEPWSEEEYQAEFEMSSAEKTEKLEKEKKAGKFTSKLLEAKAAGLYITSDEFLDNAIRIMLGLICLMISLINFVPSVASIILSVAAVVFCGAAVAVNAFYDVKAGRVLSENVIVIILALVSLLVGHGADSALLLLVAELCFRARDSYIDGIDEREEGSLGGDDGGEISQPAEFARKALNTTTHGTRRIEKISRVYSLAVLAVAAVVAIVSAIAGGENGKEWVHRAMVFAVAAVPLTESAILLRPYKSGIISLYKKGIVVRNAETVSAMSSLTSVIFDKRGTITSNSCEIVGIDPVRISTEQLLYLAAYAETYSEHPIARAIKERAGVEIDKSKIVRHVEESGSGVFVQLSTKEIISAGNYELLERLGVRGSMDPSENTVVYVAVDRTYVGRIEFVTELNPGAAATVAGLRAEDIANVALITGDNTMSANAVGRSIGINEIYADCLPKDKYDRVKYIVDTQERDDKLAYVCSSENSVDAMSLVDVGIVVGGMTDNAANADVIIIDSDVYGVLEAVRTSKNVDKAFKLNLIVDLVAELLIIVLGLSGKIHMWFALLICIGAMALSAYISEHGNRKRTH